MRRPGRTADPGRGLARAALLALALGALSGCGERDGAAVRSLLRLERLAYVPAGECRLSLAPGLTVDCSTPQPLLVDRFEVTRGEWSDWAAAQAPGALPPMPADWEERTRDRPATWMTLAEARAFAAAQGMRLASAREWLRIGVGTRAQRYPWAGGGSRDDLRARANTLEVALGRLAAVGTFEAGRNIQGVHDLVGNASEWVDAPIPEVLAEVAQDDRAWAMGGSYLTHSRPLYQTWREPRAFGVPVVSAETLDPRHRGVDVGLRLVVDARPFLAGLDPALGRADGDAARLRAVGERWGRAAAPLLEELAARPNAPRALQRILEGARR